MKKPALPGAPAFVLAALLCLAQPCLGQDGPVFPGFEPSDPEPASVVSDEPLSPPAVEEPLPVEESPRVEEELTLPVDNSITPLDENGQPMREPVGRESLRLPAPPPLPVAAEGETNLEQLEGSSMGEGPSLGEEPQGQAGDAEPAKKNLWKRSTDALRDLTRPKPEKLSPAEEDAARSWQKLRRQTLPPQQGQPQGTQPGQQRQMQQQGGPQNVMPQTSAQQRQLLQQQQLRQQQQMQMQRQMQVRQMQQRQLELRQLEQRQMQQRQLKQGQIQQGQIQQRYGQPNVGSAGAPSTYGNPAAQSRLQATQPQSSRRQVQRPVSQPAAGQPRSTVAPSARGRQPSQPREAKNDPRSPWERS